MRWEDSCQIKKMKPFSELPTSPLLSSYSPHTQAYTAPLLSCTTPTVHNTPPSDPWQEKIQPGLWSNKILPRQGSEGRGDRQLDRGSDRAHAVCDRYQFNSESDRHLSKSGSERHQLDSGSGIHQLNGGSDRYQMNGGSDIHQMNGGSDRH